MNISYVVYFANNITHSVSIVKAFNEYFDAIQYCIKMGGFKTTIERKGTFYLTPKGNYYIKTAYKRETK